MSTFFVCESGELFTWGKGRYGRLGHGDSEDQLKPKIVEALVGHRVVDVACGMEICLPIVSFEMLLFSLCRNRSSGMYSILHNGLDSLVTVLCYMGV